MSKSFVLHITNDFSGSTVYMNLIRELDELNIPQIIYTPVREKNLVNKNFVKLKTKGSRIIYSPILNYHLDRYFYFFKIKKIYKDISKQVDFSKICFMHAHTWYSDGGVAYEISKKYNIPYIVAIRSTDLNVFQKLQFYLRPYGRSILKNAQKVITINVASFNEVLNLRSLKNIKTKLREKLLILQNGVDPFWIENATDFKEKLSSINIVYIGKFIQRKKVLPLMHAVLDLQKELDKKIHLNLVGGGGRDHLKVLQLVNQHKSLFTYHGQIYKKEELENILKEGDIFAMPSIKETFGLVYIEAMLQGLPVLYTEGEGIDGFYAELIGEKVSYKAYEKEIKDAILTMIENYDRYSIPKNKLMENHDWRKIALKYKSVYNEKNRFENK